MKKAFEKLSDEKKGKIIHSCIEEFGERGYEGSSIDRIIRKAGISKGGLYEYVSSKEELFIFIVEYTYEHLYGYINKWVEERYQHLPEDVLQRLAIIAEPAIDFYIDHPEYIFLIVRTYRLSDAELEKKVNTFFSKKFYEIFGNVEAERLKYGREKVLDLIMWFLHKTRYDFLMELKRVGDPARVKENYMKNWEFYLYTMKRGIYT